MKKERLLAVKLGVNFRELGGYRTADGRQIRWQKLLRSGSLFAVSNRDLQQLIDYGWRVNLDLRGPAEVSTRPDPPLKPVSYHNLSIYPFASDKNQQSWWKRLWTRTPAAPPEFANYYSKLLGDSHALQTYQAIFAQLLAVPADGGAVLFHCSAGQDRTGIVALLIEQALGVPLTVCQQDYYFTALATQASFNPSTRKFVNRQNSEQPPKVTPTKTAAQNWQDLTTFLTTNYGDWPTYLATALKLSNQDLHDLQRLYLSN